MRNLGSIVLGLLFLAAAAFITAILLGWTGPIYSLLQDIAGSPIYSLLVAVVFVLLAVFAFSTVRVRENEQIAVMTSSKFGQIRISDRTIEEIVSRAGMNVDGIKELVPKVYPMPEGINISVSALMNPEFVIPTVVEQMQEIVKSDVEKYTGLKVAEVKVMVRGLDSPGAVRIR